mgnify:CR=1 FL=1
MLGLRAFRVTQEPRAQRDLPGLRVTLERLDQKVLQDPPDLRVILEPLDLKAQLEPTEPTELTVTASQVAPTTPELAW